MFCREMYKEGRFGDFAYGAAQYYHHIDSISYGRRPNEGGMPPLFYATHSTAMILSSVDSYAKKVVCFGYEDKTNDGRFGKGCNEWDNTYSNQYMLLMLANGGTARITEARTFGYNRPTSFISGLYGTEGSYECSNAQHLFVEKTWKAGEPEKCKLTDVSDYVNTCAVVENKNEPDFKERVCNGDWQWDSMAKIQVKETARLPKEYKGMPNGHMCSHQFLMDDFCRAVYNHEQPILNAWKAARYTIPGLVGIESARQGGMPLDIPDCGDGPN
jgi:hypothetical protein